MANINETVIDINDLRINKLRSYLLRIIDTLLTDKKYQINANMLSADINNYSIDKIPTETVVEKWITGNTIQRDLYSFRSRNSYSQDTLNNLLNVGFFEKFEDIINSNNEKGILPEIENIERIECFISGCMTNASTISAEFDIQIQITYRN